MDFFILGVIWYLIFLISTILHEVSHGFAAKLLGDPTAYNNGQVTLDPIPHIKREPWGTVIIPLLFYTFSGWIIGWASVPYDLVWARNNHKKAALMAMAGPLANLLLVIISAVLIKVFLATGFFVKTGAFTFSTSVESLSGLATMMYIAFVLNLILFVYNLMPFPPLDGSKIIEIFMDKENAERFSNFINSPLLSIFGVFFALLIFYQLFPIIQALTFNLLIG